LHTCYICPHYRGRVFAFLQLRAISTGKASQVKACHAMRGALELLDFEDASINDMKRMLLQVCVDG
jgi:hypothetical protein